VAIDLGRALDRLRPAERTCIVLALREGMSHAEVARATGLPLGTVKSHVARGTAKLRALLEPG
jgi:RNA polymerase sigma-70 factor (ECF subfamily)